MGCSSGLLKDNGEFEPNGIVMQYLTAGCPAVIANLWDVTDKDINTLAKALLQSWGENCSSRSLSSELVRAREVCYLKYINGAAPVYYGVPVFVKSKN